MKPNPSFLLLLVLLQMFFLSCYSQHKRIKFDHLTTENGLSQSNILCILQDSRGFMWFGTEDGLNRYDGYRIKVYRKDHNSNQSLSNNHVTAITEDTAGNLWIGTLGGGLNMFHREKETFTHYQHDQNNPGSLHSNFINHLI
jgi:ligand-binding sensor domain-containing protein